MIVCWSLVMIMSMMMMTLMMMMTMEYEHDDDDVDDDDDDDDDDKPQTDFTFSYKKESAFPKFILLCPLLCTFFNKQLVSGLSPQNCLNILDCQPLKIVKELLKS